MPVFYRDNMYRKDGDGVFLKLYDGNDWIWKEVRLKKTDLAYIRRHWTGVKERSPVLVKKYRQGRGLQHHDSGRNCRRKEVHQLRG